MNALPSTLPLSTPPPVSVHALPVLEEPSRAASTPGAVTAPIKKKPAVAIRPVPSKVERKVVDDGF